LRRFIPKGICINNSRTEVTQIINDNGGDYFRNSFAAA